MPSVHRFVHTFKTLALIKGDKVEKFLGWIILGEEPTITALGMFTYICNQFTDCIVPSIMNILPKAEGPKYQLRKAIC